MAPLDYSTTLSLHRTARYSVLVVEKPPSLESSKRQELPRHLPVLSLEDLLLHQHRTCSDRIQRELKDALFTQGFCLLTTSIHSRPAILVNELRDSLKNDLFPSDDDVNAADLQTSETIYISERDVPMYRLGYERTEDNVRQIYRIAAGRPDEQPWPSRQARETFLKALGLMRHVTDTALELLLNQAHRDNQTSCQTPTLSQRPYSGSATWCKDAYSQSDLQSLVDRQNDYSVLYGMHYFGTGIADEHDIAVKQHVDPSLLVLEPFLCPNVRGLQVWDRTRQTWLDCDGPESPMHALAKKEQAVMLLFVGKGLQAHLPELEPTLHRVVASEGPRRTVIYEQKYGEFYS
jgi:hypothetical protein